MKQFVTYTLMRLALFVVVYAVVLGVWTLVFGSGPLIQLPPLIIAMLISGIVAFVLLDEQREAFAERVDARAKRVSSSYEKSRSREDEDEV
ncbi:intracellular septation protein A [Nocardioides zeae]|uniref:Intracellular septation protein A n=2 Tax=Nocardioides zeae TaxID=1457234 RepID=A0AAJ1U5S1_9ACTN|nr:DUF4229 domain-containing protein [Nocardioides zeae]MDQ1106515.1 intracellular septation protein A [Nocardioides zeae]MDR6173805.1 intracellular septation protein A [Nocardioides zeae]MDR6211907.1 intracellular septation protein A [Nocardioides zeae]